MQVFFVLVIGVHIVLMFHLFIFLRRKKKLGSSEGYELRINRAAYSDL
jgi:hypothetical protein